MQLKPQHLESGTEGSLELLYQSAFHKYPYVHVHRPPTHTHTLLSSFFSLSSSPQEIKILCCGGIRFAYMTKLEHTICSTTDRKNFRLAHHANCSILLVHFVQLFPFFLVHRLPLILSYPDRELSPNRFRFVHYIFCCHVKE